MAKSIAEEIVLFVDDEESILNALRRELHGEEYRCLFALSGNQALKIMQQENVSVIVSDMKMPEMDGLRLLRIVKDKYPTTARVVLSGYTQLPQILVTVNQAEVFKFLTKPWGGELKSVIHEALNYHRLLADRQRIEQLIGLQYNDPSSLIQKIETTIIAARKSNILFSALATKAFEFASEALSSPESLVYAREQLILASMLLQTIAHLDFEEYDTVTIKTIYDDINQQLQNKNIRRIEIDTEVYSKTIRFWYKALSGLIAAVILMLTDYPEDYIVKLKPKITETAESYKHEVTVFITPMNNENANSDGFPGQRAYVDMLNAFASKVLSMLNGEFIGLIAQGVIILRIVVHNNNN